MLQEYSHLLQQQVQGMNKEKVELTQQEKTQRFFKLVEAGDISLFQTFEEAVAIFGFTKVGKTSSCHILSNTSPLKAELQNGDLIYRPTTQKYSSAAVGITSQSETQIPNIFETRIKDKNGFKTLHLLDQPGYGDTYGFHRIFSNGYFHYRTFSKTPKLKFILAVKKAYLQDTGEKFKTTIQNFINTFIRYDDIKASILDATSFLITQVEAKSTVDNVRSIITRLRNESVDSMTKEEKKRYQELIDNMLSKNKVFIIQKPEQAGSQTKESDILKQIYDKTKFWEREVKKNGIVDMKEINFSCGAQILTNLNSFKGSAKFREDFDSFMTFTQDRINKILLNHEFSLRNIIQIMKNDAVGSVDSHSFLEGMVKFIDIFYKFDQKFKTKREKLQVNLFNLAELNDSGENTKIGLINKQAIQAEQEYRDREMRQVYFIKKFKVLEFVKERTDAIMILDKKLERSVEWLQQISTYFIELFKKFNCLRVQKNDSERIIYKYSYVIQRLIEQAKITTLILFSNKQLTAQFDKYKQNMVDIFRPLQDKLFAHFGDIDLPGLKEDFISNIDLSSFDIVNKDIISFFESIKVDKKMRLKLADLVIKYADNIKDKRNVKDEEKRFVAYKLFNYRNQFYQDMLTQKSKNTKASSLQNLFVISNTLGHLLLGFNFYEEARQVYKSTNNADRVFKIYDAELASVDQNNLEKCRSLLIEYGKYAGFCHREELAMKCFQEAYGKSKTYQQFKEVSDNIMDLKKVKAKDEIDPYLAKFYQEEFCSAFPEWLKNKIELMYKGTNLFA